MPGGEPSTVLVVEDDAAIREALRDALGDEGYVTVEAREGQEAIDYLRANRPPSAILLDWNMSPMNGGRFLEEIGKDPSLSKIPVVLMTADARLLDVPHAVAGRLRKPVSLDVLLDVVRDCCG
jgi:CheY-like chemotaxis protein